MQVEEFLGAEKEGQLDQGACLEDRTASSMYQIRKACSMLKKAAAAKRIVHLPQKAGDLCSTPTIESLLLRDSLRKALEPSCPDSLSKSQSQSHQHCDLFPRLVVQLRPQVA